MVSLISVPEIAAELVGRTAANRSPRALEFHTVRTINDINGRITVFFNCSGMIN